VLRTMFRLGMLDPMEEQIYPFYSTEVVDAPEARQASLQAAEEGIVLLKNDGILPLGGATMSDLKMAFIGPQANYTQLMLSAPQYHGQNKLVEGHSPLIVASLRGWDVSHAPGCAVCDTQPSGYPNMPCTVQKSNASHAGFSAALDVARASQLAILFLGNDQTTEAENFDRSDISLPGAQQALLEAVCTVQSNVVLVLQNGGPIAVDWAKESGCVRAIVEAFQPGQLGGDAILNVLSGEAVPSGKLPYTVYTEAFTVARDIREMDLRAAGGVTSWWSRQPVLWPFGFGLSYTTFAYKWSNTPPARETIHTTRLMQAYNKEIDIAAGSMFHTVEVTNEGHMTADCVCLAFLTSTSSSGADAPLKKLFGFERLVAMKPGEKRSVSFASGPAELANANSEGSLAATPGTYGIEIGDVISPARRLVDIVGPTVILRRPLPGTPATRT